MLGKLLGFTYRPAQHIGAVQTLPFAITLIRWGIIVSVIGAGVTTAVVGIGAVSNSHYITVDPFAAYAALMPGQPTSALADFNCRHVYVPESLKQSRCTISPTSNYIESISVTSVSKNIAEVSVALSDVRIGDLYMLWGRPSRIFKERRRYVVQWANGTTAYVQYDHHDLMNLYWLALSVTFRPISL